jgi:hypothetical protein
VLLLLLLLLLLAPKPAAASAAASAATSERPGKSLAARALARVRLALVVPAEEDAARRSERAASSDCTRRHSATSHSTS